MIEEIRIITKTGLPLANFPLLLSTGGHRIHQEKDMSLFAGFISASLSMFQELENETIDEIVYHDYKIVIHSTPNLFYLCVTRHQVPTKEIIQFLRVLADKMNYFLDFGENIIEITSDLTNRAKLIIDTTIDEVFWWANPTYSLRNNFKLIKMAFTRPSGAYFVSTLPLPFIITGGILWTFVFLFSMIVGTTYSGIATYPTPVISKSVNILTFFSLWIGTAGILKLWGKTDINMTGYTILSGIYSLALLPMIFFGSYFYQYNVLSPIEDTLQGNPFLLSFFVVLIFWLPYNTSFFSFFLLNGFSTSLVQFMNPRRYIVIYTSVLMGVLALLAMIFSTVVPFF